MILKVGSNGPEVLKLQEKLGIKNPDGDFGPMTEKAVKEWQLKNGLKGDGIVGDSTWGEMFGDVKNDIVIPTSVFKLERLKGHIPESIIAQIPDTAKKFNITNILRLAHFLSQCSHESGGFRVMKENLNYSADGLKKIFGKYFPGDTSKTYARNPEKIANKVYSNRMGNGDETTGEGFKYHGRGCIQLTGKNNYIAFSKFIGEDCSANPDLVSTKYALASGAFFFDSNKLWSICDKGADLETVKAVTKRVNGGFNGLEDRYKHFLEFYNLLK